MKQLFFLILMLPGFFTLDAQNDYVQTPADKGGRFSLGVHVGPNYTYVYGTSYVKNTSTPANYLSAGMSAQYDFKKVFSVVSGLYYEKKGYRQDQVLGYQSFGITSPVTLHVKGVYNYITVPVMVKASFGKRGIFFINAGGFISALVLANDRIHVAPGHQKQVDNVTSSYHLLDLGVAAGAGFAFPLTPRMKFTMEVRNATGLTDIGKKTISSVNPMHIDAIAMLFGLVYKL